MEQRRESVIAVRKNGDDDIMELKLSNGQVVDYKEAQQMAKSGMIVNVNVFKGPDGEEHLRSNPDGDPTNNLDTVLTEILKMSLLVKSSVMKYKIPISG